MFLWLLLGQLLPFLFGFGFEAGLSPYTPYAGLDLRTLFLQPSEYWGYRCEVNRDKSYRQTQVNRCSWIRSRECECWQSRYRNNQNTHQQRKHENTTRLTEQQSAAITCNTADKTHRTVRKGSQAQRPHTEFIYIEYKAAQCIYGAYSPDNGNLWWSSSQRGVESPGVQGSPHPTLWSRHRWHRCTLGGLRDFPWLHLLWYSSRKNHWIHEKG